MKRIIAFFISLILLFTGLFSACDIAGTKWTLADWSATIADPGGYSITLEFDKRTFSGRSAVNSYGGDYITLPGDKIKISGIFQTEMAGPPEAMQAEGTYFDLLGKVQKYAIKDDTLTLLDENGDELLVFEKTP